METNDYTKPYTDLYSLLPSVYKSEFNKTLTKDIFDRFLTKPELVNVVGTLTQNFNDPLRLPELDTHRQNFQLQPLLYTKLATEDQSSSFQDLIRKARSMGVDYSEMDQWASAPQYNFCPPVDIDKQINFSSYYWFDDTQPQYITIKNRFAQLSLIVTNVIKDNPDMKSTFDEYETTSDPVVKDSLRLTIEQFYPSFSHTLDEYFYNIQYQTLYNFNKDGWDSISNGVPISSVDIPNNAYRINDDYVETISNFFDSGISLRVLCSNGDYAFYTVSNIPVYDSIRNQTIITLVELVDSDIDNCLIELGNYDAIMDGVSILEWSSDSLVVTGNYFDQLSSIDQITVSGGVNSGTYDVIEVAYDVNTNRTSITIPTGSVIDVNGLTGRIMELGMYDKVLYPISSIPNPYNFEIQSDPWFEQNKWTHISDLPNDLNVSSIQQAKQPIIEYEPFIELNEWLEVKHNWIYSANGLDGYNHTDSEPISSELFSHQTTAPILSNDGVDVLIYAPSGTEYLIIDNQITVIFDEVGIEYYTIINVVDNLDQTFVLTLDRSITRVFLNAKVEMIRYTSKGDDWKGFRSHWVYDDVGVPLPCSTQPISEVFDVRSPLHDLTRYETITALGTYTNWYKLDNIVTTMFDQIRVYINGQRNYGTYRLGYTNDGVSYDFDTTYGINAIFFINYITAGSIRVEVGPIAQSDEVRRAIPVRVSVDDPKMVNVVSLIKYIKNEQRKESVNQYPLFNVYRLNGDSANTSNALWKFEESPEHQINPLTNKRDRITAPNIHHYEQTLLDEKSGNMFAYKQSGKLKVLWRNDPQNATYVPKFINTEFEEVDKNDPTGDWELPKQMSNNLEHENRKFLSSIDTFRHFNTMINSQQPYPNYTGNGGVWRLLSSPQYGAGGTIKEYGYGFDTFLSTLLVPGINYIQLFEYAKYQYSSNINAIQNIFCEMLPRVLASNDVDALKNIELFVYHLVKDVFEDSEYLSSIYGDTTMYDRYTLRGVKNWIATPVRFGMLPAIIPKLSVDETLNLTLVTHHDGHQSNVSLHNSTITKIIERLIKQPNVTKGLKVDRPSVVGSAIGAIYYATDTSQIYKNSISVYSSIQPTEVCEGLLWLNTNTNQLYVYKTYTGFSLIGVHNAWKLININTLLGNVEYQIERDLYDFCVRTKVTYPLNDIKTDPRFQNKELLMFKQFMRSNQVANPMSNNNFRYENAFSWNYSSSPLTSFNVDVSEWSVSPSTWYNMYEKLYNTRYPNLEPWILQGYETKPSWWDGMYNISPTRSWTTNMWTNVLRGDVPVGKSYPNGVISGGIFGDPGYVNNEGILIGGTKAYTHIPVNMLGYSTSDGAYGPDDLLPPFLDYTDVNDLGIMQQGVLMHTAVPVNIASEDYVYGTNGPMEDIWRRTIDYNYDLMKIAYAMDPIRFTYQTFGYDNHIVDQLSVDIISNKVPSHRDAIFHGDMVDGYPISISGVNQWIVNYLRYRTQDIDISTFRNIWNNWRPKLSYQTGSYVDDRNVIVRTSTNIFDSVDYKLINKTTPGFKDTYIDSLRVAVTHVGDYELKYGVQIPASDGSDWNFKILTSNPKFNSIKLYGITPNNSPITFRVLDGTTTSTIWNHYPVDKSSVLEFTPDTNIDELGPNYEGVQGLVNFIDGYKSFLEDQGLIFTDTEYTQIDEVYGRVIDWQFETEKLIEQVYVGLVTDKMPINFMGKWNQVVVDVNTNELIFVNPVNFRVGELIQFNSTGVLPIPIVANELYELYEVNGNRCKLKTSEGSLIIFQTLGRGIHTCGTHKIEVATPQSYYEVNPFRNVVVFSHPQGLLSNINTGSYVDIAYQTGVYDQYGRVLDPTAFKVYRTDNQTVIKFNAIPDDVSPGNTLHMGGMHLYVDGHEHVIMFSDELVDGGILFDEFLGVSISKVQVNLQIGYKDTMRPNVGGRFNLDNALVPNFEASIHELQHMYDTHIADEDSPLTIAGRNLLGYTEKDYLTDIGVTTKSQFLFYRGMIQQKGSVNAITAFINMRKFIDAKVDDYWAYKVNDFGDVRPIQKPQLKLIPSDTHTNKLLLEFEDKGVSMSDQYVPVMIDDERWVNLPNLKRNLFRDGNMFFDANVESVNNYTWDDVTSDGYLLHVPIRDMIINIPQNNRYQYVMDITKYPLRTFTTSSPFVMDRDSVTIVVYRGSSQGYSVPKDLFTLIDSTHISIQGFDVGYDIWNLEDGDVITIDITNAVLKESVHYSRINSKCIRFDQYNPMQVMDFITTMEIYGLDVSDTKVTPLRLYDSRSDVEIDKLMLWNPAKGNHDVNSSHIIDYIGTDPARYNQGVTEPLLQSKTAWDAKHVESVWMDDTNLYYKPYNDTVLYPSIDRRLQLWGQPQEWCKFELYEWVETTIQPQLYEEYVKELQQSGTIISGSPRRTINVTYRNPITNEFDQGDIELRDIVLDGYMPIVQGNVIDISTLVQDYRDGLIDQHYSIEYVDYACEYYIEDGDVCSVYRNGIWIAEVAVTAGLVDLSPIMIDSYKWFTIVFHKTNVSVEDLEFDPTIEDDLAKDKWYQIKYPCTRIEHISADGHTSEYTYYFWVSNTASIRDGLTFAQAKNNILKTSRPYVVVDNFIGENKTEPNRYNRLVVRGLVNRVTNEDRYVLQFVKDLTLRDDVEDSSTSMNLKNKHTQWKMFRERQRYNIDRYLWNKLTETCAGCSMDDLSIIVPSLDYVLYDNIHATTYAYGIGEGQMMIDKDRAIEIVIAQIMDPSYDLYPIVREDFFNEHKFDSKENIQQVMKLIYETFLPQHVNRIWFAVFLESLSRNINFKDIMKTSWIQLDGVRLLDESGVLNDGSY